MSLDQNKYNCEYKHNDSTMEQDFILKIKTANPHTTRTWIQSYKNEKAAMLCFYPKFDTTEVNSEM